MIRSSVQDCLANVSARFGITHSWFSAVPDLLYKLILGTYSENSFKYPYLKKATLSPYNEPYT